MIIFLYGQNSYMMRQKLNEIVDGYKKVHKNGLDLKYFDFSKSGRGDVSFSGFQEGIRQASMFQEKKLLIVTNPFSNIDFKEMFLKQGQDFLKSQDIIVFYEEENIDKRNALFKFLDKNAKCQEFKSLTGQKIRNWIIKEINNHNGKIEPIALEKLVHYVGDDLWRLSNEIKKLISYKKNKEISIQDVELLIRSKIETDIFKTIDAIAENNKKQALKLLNKHLEKGDSPLYLLSMINYQFRNLLIIKDFIEKHSPYNIILKKSGLHPFVVRKSYSQCQQFSFPELKKIYQKIFKVDIDIKTGKLNPEIALDLLIAEI